MDSPKPGRSGEMTRMFRREARREVAAASRREEGKPWRKKSGRPVGEPYVAKPSVRPEGRRRVCESVVV